MMKNVIFRVLALLVLTCALGVTVSMPQARAGDTSVKGTAKSIGRSASGAVHKMGHEGKKVGKAVGNTAKEAFGTLKKSGRDAKRLIKGNN